MPDFFLDTSRPEVVKAFNKQLWAEWRQNGALWNPDYGLVGSGPEYCITEINDLQRGAGDEVTIPYIFQLDDDAGVMGAEVLEGKETAPDYGYFKLKINKQRYGTQVYGEMFQQMVHFDVAKNAKQIVKDWFLNRREVSAMNQLSGFTPQSDLRFTGLNAVTALQSANVHRPGAHTTDLQVRGDSTATFDVDLLAEVRAKLDMMDPPIEPLSIGGFEGYVVMMHPNVKADLDSPSSTFFDISKSALQGGLAKDHPFFSRIAGAYQDFLFVVNPFCVQGISGTSGLANTRQSLVLGRKALGVSYGRSVRNTKDPFSMYLGARDHDDKLITSCKLIWGCKRATATKADATVKDIGVMSIVTYSADRIPGQANKGQTVTEV